jgi:hypothetical protein
MFFVVFKSKIVNSKLFVNNKLVIYTSVKNLYIKLIW